MRAKPAEGKAWTEVKEDAEMKYGIANVRHAHFYYGARDS